MFAVVGFTHLGRRKGAIIDQAMSGHFGPECRLRRRLDEKRHATGRFCGFNRLDRSRSLECGGAGRENRNHGECKTPLVSVHVSAVTIMHGCRQGRPIGRRHVFLFWFFVFLLFLEAFGTADIRRIDGHPEWAENHGAAGAARAEDAGVGDDCIRDIGQSGSAAIDGSIAEGHRTWGRPDRRLPGERPRSAVTRRGRHDKAA